MSDKMVHIVGGMGGKWVHIADGYTNFDNVTDFGWDKCDEVFYANVVAESHSLAIPDPDKAIYHDVCDQLGLAPEVSD